MVVRTSQDSILKSETKQVVFAVSKEGINILGFQKYIADNYWPGLAKTEELPYGSVISHKSGEIMFHGIVCYSIYSGFPDNQKEIIKLCFDNIPSDGKVVSALPIGTQFFERHSGADFKEILEGIHSSKQLVELQTGLTMGKIASNEPKQLKKVS